MNPLLNIFGKILFGLTNRITLRARSASLLRRAQGISPELKIRIEGASELMKNELRRPSPLDGEIEQCGLSAEYSDLRLGTGLALIGALVEPIGVNIIRPWVNFTLVSSDVPDDARKNILSFLAYWARERKKGRDYAIIAGDFIGQRLAESPLASAGLRAKANQVSIRSAVGSQIVGAAQVCLGTNARG